jgi:hypothetical protein
VTVAHHDTLAEIPESPSFFKEDHKMVTEGKPSASDIVYLFGDRFAKGARIGGAQLIYGGGKVKLSDLGDKLLLVAFAGLASKGHLGLEAVEEKKLGLFTSKDLLVTRLSTPAEPLYGLEAAIWDNITGDPKKDRVRPIISRITGGTTPNPWNDLVGLAKNGLAEQGYLNVDKEELRFRPDKVHWSANEGLILPLEGRVDEVKAMLSSLETGDRAMHKQLAESVKKGIKAMVESPDSDFDLD